MHDSRPDPGFKIWDQFLEARELSERATIVRALAAELEASDDIPF